jgi:protein phosphatase
MDLWLAAITDVGRTRQHNEDCYLMWNLTGGDQIPGDGPAVRTPAADGILIGVYDGMGGAAAGEEASALAARTFAERSAHVTPDDLQDLSHLTTWLAESLRSADGRIFQAAQANPEMRGMGSTCTAMVVGEDELILAHVGDSRAYHLRDGTLRQITVDHSYVSHLVAVGQISSAEARTHRDRNVLLQVLGLGRPLEVDRVSVRLQPGDELLLCSDGLYDLVSEGEMRRGMQEQPDPAAACRHLVDLANARGGTDNITVVVARVGAWE